MLECQFAADTLPTPQPLALPYNTVCNIVPTESTKPGNHLNFEKKRSRSEKTILPDPPTLAFLEKSRVFHKKSKGFSFRGTPKIIGKERKTRKKKARKIGKRKKQGNRKKQGLEGQGSEQLLEFRGILGAILGMAVTTEFIWKPYSRSNSRSFFFFKIWVVPVRQREGQWRVSKSLGTFTGFLGTLSHLLRKPPPFPRSGPRPVRLTKLGRGEKAPIPTLSVLLPWVPETHCLI